MSTIERGVIPQSPEASLRNCVDDVVFMFADPTQVTLHGELVELEIDNGMVAVAEMPPDHAHYHGDTIVEKNIGRVGLRILTQEFPDPELDQRLPHYIALSASHKLGDIFVHVTLPDYHNPSLAPTKEQKSRPAISTVVESKTYSQFDRDFILNEILGEVDDPQEQQLLVHMQSLVRSVRTKPSKSQYMTDAQMQQLEELLSDIFWPGAQERTPLRQPETSRLARAARRVIGFTRSKQ